MIPLYRATITRKEMDILLSNIIEGHIAPGEVEKLAIQQLVTTLGFKQGYGTALRSYVQAYTIAIEGLALLEGSGIGVSPFTPQAIISVIEQLGCVPRVLAVDTRTLLLQPEAIEDGVSQGLVQAVLLESPAGNLVNPKHYEGCSVPIIEDITWTIGGTIAGQGVGSLGAVVILSADHQGAIALGGGGLVMTTSMGVWKTMRKSTLFTEPSYRLPDINSSLALTQLKQLKSRAERKMNIHKLYAEAVRKSGRHKGLLVTPEDISLAPPFFPLLLSGSTSEVIAYGKKKGVEIAPLFDTIDTRVYAKQPQVKDVVLRGVKLPLYPLLARKEIDTITRCIATLP